MAEDVDDDPADAPVLGEGVTRFETRHGFERDADIARTIVEAVAAVVGLEPTAVTPLYDAVDPEALERLLVSVRTNDAPDVGGASVAFVNDGWVVTVESTGTVRLETSDARRPGASRRLTGRAEAVVSRPVGAESTARHSGSSGVRLPDGARGAITICVWSVRSGNMRYAFFTNTPAHVHLYRNAVNRLEVEGHDVLVMARDYGCTRALVEYYGLPHRIYGACQPTALSLLKELPRHFLGITRGVGSYGPDMVFGMGSYAAFAGAWSGAATVLLLDSEPTGLDHLLSRPFARSILTPAAFRKDLGPKHHRFRGFKECAYLHPAVFEPDSSVREALGVGPDERYAMVRFNAFGSHHDIGRRGFALAEREALLREIADRLPVFVSAEDGRGGLDHPDVHEYDLHPGRIHDALAEASLLVADSQTMVTESALLGTPTIRSNSFVGDADMGNFVELERQGLVWNVRDFDDVVAAIRRIASDEAVERRWRERRAEYVSTLVDLTEVIVDIARHAGTVPYDTAPIEAPVSSG